MVWGLVASEFHVAKSFGVVYLVGAGPGDPGLLTLRGLECLRRADLVLYDGLVNSRILRHTAATAIRTCRVCDGTGLRLDQSDINRQLIEAAREGKTVVRLKGGDPFVFGRGSEEAAALAQAGIAFEVVPGVTAAIAAAEYSGISVTHREQASAVAFVTGHEDPEKNGPRLDFTALAQFPGTLVFYMGLHRLPHIAESLIAAGKGSETAAAVISQASLPTQRTVTGTLATIAAEVATAGLRPPSLIVVGECVRQRERIAWFEQRPLFGKRIGVTRAEEQAEPQFSRILELGAEPVLMPTLRIDPPETWAPVDDVMRHLGDRNWIVFTSVNGVRSFFSRLWKIGLDLRALGQARLAAIGRSTAEALNEFHVRADIVPSTFRSEGLVEALRPLVANQRVLWVRADRARDVLRTELTSAGALLEEVIAYRHHDLESWPDDVVELLTNGNLDWIGVSSPAIARNIVRMLPSAAWPNIGQRIRVASISPVTTATCREVGLPVSVEAAEHTWNGIFSAIMQAEQAVV